MIIHTLDTLHRIHHIFIIFHNLRFATSNRSQQNKTFRGEIDNYPLLKIDIFQDFFHNRKACCIDRIIVLEIYIFIDYRIVYDGRNLYGYTLRKIGCICNRKCQISCRSQCGHTIQILSPIRIGIQNFRPFRDITRHQRPRIKPRTYIRFFRFIFLFCDRIPKSPTFLFIEVVLIMHGIIHTPCRSSRPAGTQSLNQGIGNERSIPPLVNQRMLVKHLIMSVTNTHFAPNIHFAAVLHLCKETKHSCLIFHTIRKSPIFIDIPMIIDDRNHTIQFGQCLIEPNISPPITSVRSHDLNIIQSPFIQFRA